ncbi:MAG: UDP-N-acetylglucosamine 2-epimerase (non-hydrolyzing) [Thermotogae bacterium]|nr:UDP-N-acetylglucosamine 2-epimerase (non-hydrolyzing) [Thermotogota bacterium]
MKILTVFGTRPEAIKLAPIINELKKYPEIENKICITAQHREMLDQVLSLFGIEPDIDLNLMEPNQSLSVITSKVLERITELLCKERPDLVLIQGDTTTVMATAMAAFYQKIRIGHVEAGLRTNNILSPFPEEFNRRIVSIVSSFHFTPTERAYKALIKEGVPKNRVFLTGNPVIDALYWISNMPIPRKAKNILQAAGINGNKNDRKIILVTAHRRENFGAPLENICFGLKALVERNPDIVIIYPVHLNPNVQKTVYKILTNCESIFLVKPVEYDVLIHLMKASYLILTDSGGIQEEAPSLGKPVLVMRKETERPEGIEVGTAKLVGINKDRIIKETEKLLYDQNEYMKMAKAVNPYGDGKSAKRIVDIILKNT